MTRSFLIALALLSQFVAPAPAAAMTSATHEWSARFCTREYRPVCAITRFGRVKTFANACEARNARARIIRRGPCPGRR